MTQMPRRCSSGFLRSATTSACSPRSTTPRGGAWSATFRRPSPTSRCSTPPTTSRTAKSRRSTAAAKRPFRIRARKGGLRSEGSDGSELDRRDRSSRSWRALAPTRTLSGCAGGPACAGDGRKLRIGGAVALGLAASGAHVVVITSWIPPRLIRSSMKSRPVAGKRRD